MCVVDSNWHQLKISLSLSLWTSASTICARAGIGRYHHDDRGDDHVHRDVAVGANGAGRRLRGWCKWFKLPNVIPQLMTQVAERDPPTNDSSRRNLSIWAWFWCSSFCGEWVSENAYLMSQCFTWSLIVLVFRPLPQPKNKKLSSAHPSRKFGTFTP